MEFFRCKKETKPRIQYEATDYDSLCKDIEQATYSNENNDYKHLENFIKSHLNKNKTKKYKIMNLPKDDWINKEVINMINNRNMLWRRLKSKNGDENLKKEFIKVRNEVQLRIRKDKKNYFHKKFQYCKGNPKKMWEEINSLAMNKTKSNCVPPKLIVNSQITTDGDRICDVFNDFFSTVGAELASKIPSRYHRDSGNTLMYRHGHQHEITLTTFKPCTTQEVADIVDSLDTNTSTGADEISTKSIKCIKNTITTPLANCINKCFDLGIFPDSLKLAKVSPIYKSGSKTDPGNYRPISVLPVMSKIFEKIVYIRLNEYLCKKRFLIDQQYGFRQKSNTLSAATDLITNIKTKIDEKHICLGIFIDLKKAFDTYLIEVWGSASKTHIKDLQISQNKIIKRLYNYDFLTPTKQLYKKTKLFNVSQLYNYNMCVFIKKILDNNIQTNITFTKRTFTHSLRNTNKLFLRQPRTIKYGKKNILYEGVQLYNKLPNAIKDSESIQIYKRKLQEYILNCDV
ncbi:hypothetical protein ABMA28_011774 [Loxostege sticticalis]|uniref:Reverse transcriptase domain-containing protein n=1 Tax=Loxostege sticticalis TaxID=481309 RepID=A0ABD0TKM0_LOXSC